MLEFFGFLTFALAAAFLLHQFNALAKLAFLTQKQESTDRQKLLELKQKEILYNGKEHHPSDYFKFLTGLMGSQLALRPAHDCKGFSIKKFIELLLMNPAIDDVYYFLTSNVEFGERAKMYHLQLTHEGVTMKGVIQFQDIETLDPTTSPLSSKFDLPAYLEKGKLELARRLVLVIPAQDCDENCQIALQTFVAQAVQTASVKIVPKTGEKTASYYQLISAGGYSRLARFYFAPNDCKGIENYVFPSIQLTYQGQVGKNNGAQTVRFLEEAVKGSRNIAILSSKGAPSDGLGVGKTTLLENLINELRQEVVFFRFDLSILKEFASNPTFQAELITLLQGEQKGRPLVLFMDEARTMTSADASLIDTLLQLMDGTLKKSLQPVSIIMAINAPLDSLSPAVKRPGRLDVVVELGGFDVDQAKRFTDTMAKERGQKFDTAKIQALYNKGTRHTLAEICAAQQFDDSLTKLFVVG